METVTLTPEQFELINSAAYREGVFFAQNGLSCEGCLYTNSRLRAAWLAGYRSVTA